VQFLVGIIWTLFCLVIASPTQATTLYASSQTGLKISDGLVWLEVHVSGRSEPLHFVLDTGAGVTVINAEVAKELNLKPGKRLSVRGIQGNAPARWMKGFAATVASVSLPEKVLALDLSNISSHCRQRIDGLLGADFFHGHKVQLDFVDRQLRVDSSCKSLSAEAIQVPIEQRNDAWCAVARVNWNRPCWLRLDTGFDGELHWWPGTGKENPATADSTVALNVGSTTDNLSSLEIGSLTFGGVNTTILPRQLFARESGLIGLQLLSQYRLTFAVDERRVIFEPASD